LSVFYFPRNQEELAGTDGLESMRQPFFADSRITVVLYREDWGKTPWTRVEATAITDSCLKRGWNHLFFVSLDSDAALPIWLPQTHVRLNYESFGLEQAVGAIKARVQEHGGELVPATALAHARVVHAEAERLRRKEELFQSQRWISDSVLPSVAELFGEVVRLTKAINTETGLQLRANSDARHCGITDGRVTTHAAWSQEYSNRIGHIKLADFETFVGIPGDTTRFVIGNIPSAVDVFEIRPDLSVAGELCWTDERNPSQQMSFIGAADFIVRQFLDLHRRANNGQIDFTPDFVKRFRQEREY